MIEYRDEVIDVDWRGLKAALAADRFDNGRTSEQLKLSFQNSFAVCMVWSVEESARHVIATARVLSDGVCNALLVDLWTASSFRRQGIASAKVNRLCARLPGQHLYLQSDDEHVDFYRSLSFKEQPTGMARVVGQWISAPSR
jgi:predicted GNAT family acetyltransferase